jgi:hypothetical protein
MAAPNEDFQMEFIFPQVHSLAELGQSPLFQNLSPQRQQVIGEGIMDDPVWLSNLCSTNVSMMKACQQATIPVGPNWHRISVYDYVKGDLVNALLWQWAYFVTPSLFIDGDNPFVQTTTYNQSQEIYDRIFGPNRICSVPISDDSGNVSCIEFTPSSESGIVTQEKTSTEFVAVTEKDIADSADDFYLEGQYPNVFFKWVPLYGTEPVTDTTYFTVTRTVSDQEVATKSPYADATRSDREQRKNLFDWVSSQTFRDEVLNVTKSAYASFAQMARQERNIRTPNADTWWLPDLFEFEWYVQVKINNGALEYNIFGSPLEVQREDE